VLSGNASLGATTSRGLEFSSMRKRMLTRRARQGAVPASRRTTTRLGCSRT
jgi:hypothetical protein